MCIGAGAAINAIGGMVVINAASNSSAPDFSPEIPDAANDSEYGDGDECPPDCREWLMQLNKAYHALTKMSEIAPDVQQLNWTRFWDRVRRYEAVCGPYSPPPSLDDIYLR
ncbi:MAG: hypothetical protein KZQ73_15905 [Candidatus Thiodiazotropha sp. (ex Semelilucina semeliformis)]|nr:hypothetical protein [Candidatus Thiodiazotropha sp. (ex Semelilucina semeliformis)]